MATLPAFLSRTGLAACPDRPGGLSRVTRDPFRLRALPQEDVFFYCKKIDNSRVIREPDPQARGACWSAIGAACVLLALLASAFAPSVASTLAGYRLETLRAEERRLLDERQILGLKEAELLSPERLDRLAREKNLVAPSPGQVYRLDGKADGAVAMVK